MLQRLLPAWLALLLAIACASPASAPTGGTAKPAAGASSAAPGAATPAPPRERVAILYPNQGANQTATLLAQEAGLYAKHGLDAEVQFLEGSPTVMQAVTAGNAQFAIVGTSASISAAFRGLDAMLIATAQPGLIYTLWANGIQRPADLRGKRVAVGRINTDPDFALQLVLDRLGLRYNEDVTAVHVDAGGDAARIAAVQAGSADGVMLTAGFSSRVRQLGYTPLVDLTAERIPYEAATVVTTRSFATAKPHAVRGFVRAFTEAIALAKKDRPAVMETYRKVLRLDDPEVMDEFYETYVERVYPEVPYVSEAGVQTVLDTLARTEPQAATVKPEQYIDNSYVREMDESGFVRQLYGR
jgi:NitT/TauT family transport system substrate-binding protein